MPHVTFVDSAGVSRSVEAATGMSLMEAARDNDIPGIVAQCGGMCACATCHVYVDEQFLALLDGPDDNEEPLLDFIDDREANSRLACQIRLTPALDGICVRTPASQG